MDLKLIKNQCCFISQNIERFHSQKMIKNLSKKKAFIVAKV